MKRIRFLLVFFALFSAPAYILATHIVGGTLTYVYNGGSSYTITLKLFRDCSSGTAAFPGNVTITVLGNNGAAFSPSRDITMSLGTVTQVSPTLDPCAIPPNPMPCVEQGVYTTTVTNLPPNPGGYHLYYQIVARNLSLTNINATCNCVGESFYAYIPGPTPGWTEDFTLNNGTTVDNGSTAWSTAAGAAAPASASVNSNLFQITGNTNAEQTWTSQSINISSFTSGVDLSVDLTESGNLDTQDSIRVYYRVNGGALIPFTTNGAIADDFTSATATQTGVIGNTVEILIRVHYDVNSPNTEIYKFDNVSVYGSDFLSNSNPVFNLFPPLFLCAGKPFTFDHSASDANGDSLVYSFYTPYDGENNAGPLDPTFPGNVATFTPITFLPGYGTTNPLGGAPLTLDPQTGQLSGTPSAIGQYVVGIKVKEYRNGVFLSETLRDFQFNIVNCPVPPPAIAGANITINDGCTGTITTSGYNTSTISWTSVSPGTSGQYNNYLSCTSNCASTNVTPVGTPPPSVNFMVCGQSATCAAQNVCDTVTVTFNPTLVVNITPTQPTVCFGSGTTPLTATASGGTPPYTYNWNTGATTSSINAGAGTFLVILGDASGCPPTTDAVIVTTFTANINANAGADKHVCITSPSTALNGAVAGTNSGVWSGGSGTFSPSANSLTATYTPTASEISNGFVDLILTSTNNGTCPGDQDTIRIFFDAFNATITPSVSQPSCNGSANGSVTLGITGSFSPFTVNWLTTPAQSGTIASGLSAGTYTYTVTNSIGCSVTQTVSVTQPAGLNSVMSTTPISCFNTSTGAATVTASGGTPGYTYAWSPSGGTGSSISNVAAGSYVVTITDTKGCQLKDTAVITQPTAFSISVTGVAPTCSGVNNGTATANVSGGTGSYTYLWIGLGITSQTATGLSSGSYTVNATDATGCVVQGTVSVNAPPPLTVSVFKTNETCGNLNNGTASSTVGGGTPAYTYLWQPGALSTANVSNLSSGNYTLTVTDAQGCQAISPFTITQPNPLTINFVNQNNVSCFGGNNGSVNASVTGGTPLYSYSWSPAPGAGQGTTSVSSLTANNYTLTVSDAQGCLATQSLSITQPAVLNTTLSVTNVNCTGYNNGSIAATTTGGTTAYSYLWMPGNTSGSTKTNIVAGTYTVITTDSKGCTHTVSATVTQPGPLIVNSSSTNSNCGFADGTASVVTGGGTAPYVVNWTPSGGSGLTTTGVLAGTYTATVTDAVGCVDTAIVTVNDNAGPTVSISSSSNVSCFGGSDGSATVTVSAGTGPFTFQWFPYGGTNATATGLIAGVYIVTVVDGNGCQSQAITTPAISEPLPLALTVSNTAVSCFGGSDGTATTVVSGGTPGYSYVWSPGGATTSSVSGLSAGSHTVNVTDANGCPISGITVLSQSSPLTASVVSTSSVSCFGGNNGSISVSASGGTVPYGYSWAPFGGSTSFGTSLSAGTYTCTITDSKGCTTTTSATIAQPVSPLSVTISNTSVSCFGGNDGTATANPVGGTSPYSYSWSPSGAVTQTVNNLSAGSEIVTVSDAQGCLFSAATIVQQSGVLDVNVSTINSTCGNANGIANAVVTGGTPGYSYLWSPSGGTASTASGLSAGTYTLTVTDTRNCVSSFPFTLVNTAGPTVSAAVINNVSCFGGANGSAAVSALGGTLPFQYAWSPSGANTVTASSLSAGINQVIVYDANGCSDTATVTITQPAALTATVSVVNNVTCFGNADGSLNVSVNGGSPSYGFSWAPSGGTNNTASGLGVGVYTVTVTDQLGCVTQVQGSITQPPVLTSSISSSQNPGCFGYQNGTATANPIGGTTPYNYNWSTTPTQFAQTATGLGSGSYTVTVTDAMGCVATSSLTLTQPNQIITTGGNSITLCIGNSGTLFATSSGGSGGPFVYLWNPGGTTGTSVVVSPTVTTTYSVTAYDLNGCPGTTDTLVATVYSLTSSNLDVTGTSPICPGTTTLIGANLTGSTGPVTYAWNNGLPSSAGSFTLTPTVPTTYVCSVTNSCGVTVTDSIVVTFTPPPGVDITSDVIDGCAPLSVQFIDATLPVPGDPVTSWFWDFGDGTSSTQQDPVHFYSQPGLYNVTLTVNTVGGCTSNTLGGVYTVSAYSIPVASFSLNSTALDLPYDQLVTNNSSTGASSYIWDFGDGTTDNSTNPTHNYTDPGTFTVTLIAMNANGCADTTTATLETKTQVVFPTAFTPDPNGGGGGSYTFDDLTNNVFHAYTSGVDKFQMLIFNRWGELIFESKDVNIGWDGYYRGQLCPQDVYVWKVDITFSDGKKFVKIGDITLLR